MSCDRVAQVETFYEGDTAPAATPACSRWGTLTSQLAIGIKPNMVQMDHTREFIKRRTSTGLAEHKGGDALASCLNKQPARRTPPALLKLWCHSGAELGNRRLDPATRYSWRASLIKPLSVGKGTWRVRTSAIAATALLTVVILLTAGFSIDPLLDWWHSVWTGSALGDSGHGAGGRRPLSGPVLVVPPTPTGNDSSVSPTRRRLILVETSPGRNVREGVARLGVDPNSPQTYVAGALLVNGAKITEIYADHVVLEKDGRAVGLGLIGSQTASGSSASDPLLFVGGAPPNSGPSVAPSKDILTDYLRPSPVFEGSKLAGYEVYAGDHAEVFAQLGLQDGDVIKAVDGAPVSDASATIRQLESLTQGRAVTASILRAGQLVTISLDGAVIAASRAPALAANPVDSQGNNTNK